MTDHISQLEKNLGIKIKNKSLFTQALTHKSLNKERNNEKFEFLGDRVIGLVLSKRLLQLYPSEEEGVLDKKLSKLVNRKTCTLISKLYNLDKFVLLGKSHKNSLNLNEKILSDLCEAIIGAVFLDKGYEYVSKLVLKLWNKELKKSHITIVDPKTRLQEYSLKLFKKLPNYKLEGLKGPNHNPTFKISVEITGSRKTLGQGNSKQNAEQNAAQKLLKKYNIN